MRAASALVLAPHFDDEVLGCGGLLAQLAAAGATVRVLFSCPSPGAPDVLRTSSSEVGMSMLDSI